MNEWSLDDEGPIAEAMAVWTGKGTLAWPQIDDARVVARFGPDVGQRLLPVLRRLYEDFYRSEASVKANGLSEMAESASAVFRKKHPTAGAAVVSALAWCYTFDHR